VLRNNGEGLDVSTGLLLKETVERSGAKTIKIEGIRTLMLSRSPTSILTTKRRPP
jgi:hypothetical protein